METSRLTLLVVSVLLLALLAAFVYWRHVWFFRNPPRQPPEAAGLLSPADGTVVYVKRVEAGEDVVVIKEGLAATVKDIVKEDVPEPKIVVGIFMSPFDVHFNRAPLRGRVSMIRHHPAEGENLYMGMMHLRILLDWLPLYSGSRHIVQNERKVTRFEGDYAGELLPAYVVQIGSRGVNAIDSHYAVGDTVERGDVFGMIRIGSQVDLVVPARDGMSIKVQAGDIVRAGETILIQ